MTVYSKNLGFAFTGSFCTYDRAFPELEKLVGEKANLYPIFSDRAQSIDTRFGKAEDFLQRAKVCTGKEPIVSVAEAEKLGPNKVLDLLIIAPCTGNTLAKLYYGITDSPVLMAAKGHLRNGKPVVLAIATNDALGANMKNIGALMNTKNLFFVPFCQDNYKAKPYSMVAQFDLIQATVEEALEGRQLQPVILAPH
jgi:dipicolinate synthase subunit B